MTIKNKLILILLCGWLAIILTGAVGLLGMHDSNDRIDALYKENVTNILKLDQITELMRNNRIQLLLALQHNSANPEIVGLHDHKLEVHTDLVMENIAEINRLFETYTAGTLSPAERKLLDDFATKRVAFVKEGLLPTREAILAGNYTEATKLTLTKINPLFKPADLAAKAIFENEAKEAKNEYDEAIQHYRSTLILVIGFVIIAVLGSGIVGMMIVRSVATGTQSLISASAALAAGDLTQRVRLTTRDELGTIGNSFDTMAEEFANVIRQVHSAVNNVSSSASQMHATAGDMADGAEHVASQAATVATAGEEMAATSSDIARSCQMAAEGARLAADEVQNGAAVIQESINVMGRISERVSSTAVTVESLGQRSDQIGQIIGTIEDIADQTNLLALNAAIEAARAGEQGRGFAVVADEVRALAERTSKATREIGAMIKNIQTETKGAVASMEEGVKEVHRGTQEAGRSGAAMEAILEQIQNLSQQVDQIATAAEEQTATTCEISGNIMQITSISNQTSQNANQSATEADNLQAMAASLTTTLNHFRIN